ncbi:MATE family efflux transporter [Vibrio sp. ZSDZ34]|uniref:Multidrug resistance protein NorM n=1 Tax=Vibrio gelatinilyticus TaxID=2893468 RepID=A0A9X1WA04_9VIBR|nr:MATE family efflux transporter [Vibrio gelatinilyticus]MCJ2376399.1 MATE family efflux transporter [Vibrio gelatinilyticus]
MSQERSFFSSFTTEVRALLSLSLPIVITQVATQGMNFVDTAMAGQSSSTDLAAIAVGTSLWMPVSLILRGILMSLTPVTAHHRGANNQSGISRDLGQMIWIAAICSLLLISYLTQAGNILTFMEVAPSAVPVATQYLQALAFGLPGIALFYTLNSFCEGMGNPRAPMFISIIGLVINIPINYVLIYGKFGFPQLGAVGCGWATSIVYWVMSALMAWYIVTHHRYKKLLLANEMKPLLRRMGELVQLGLPIGINIFIGGSIFAVISLLIGKFGATHIASAQVALNFSSMTYMIPLSISFGITIRVGHALGRGDHNAAKIRSWSGIVLTALLSLLSVSCLLLFPDKIIALYTNDPEIVVGAAILLTYTAIYQFSDALQTAANGALRGYKDTQTPMWIACVAYWLIALPIGVMLSMTDWIVPALGTKGFWFGIIVGLTIAAALMLIRLHSIITGTSRNFEYQGLSINRTNA